MIRTEWPWSDTTLADDLGRKRALYATAAVPEYWIVDVFGRALHQCWAPADGAYQPVDKMPPAHERHNMSW